MGVYAHSRCLEVNTGRPIPAAALWTHPAWYEITTTGYGNDVVRLVVPEPIADLRYACYCCSCGERPGSDAACRNHGWAAERPCETHGMSGSPWGEEAGPDLDGVMPESVQLHRLRGVA